MLAYIDARHQEWLELGHSRADNATSPVDGVLAVFDAYIEHVEVSSPGGFRGCGLLNAAAEPPAGAAGREAVRRHKAEVQSMLSGHLMAVTPRESAQEVAEHLALLLEGAVSLAGLGSRPGRLEQTRDIARRIVEAL